ncbi:hypothetical protein NQZ68_019446 [Dissostichus eleginoides]|nr:hypothetical protein NQZ68_019446 [Dissostichus eleginoides]
MTDVFDVSLKRCLITRVPLTLPLKVERTLRVPSTVRGQRSTEVVLQGAGENQGVLTDCEKKAPRGGGWRAGPSVSSPLSEEGSEELKEMLDSREHSVSDPPSNLVSSSDESCSSLAEEGCKIIPEENPLISQITDDVDYSLRPQAAVETSLSVSLRVSLKENQRSQVFLNKQQNLCLFEAMDSEVSGTMEVAALGRPFSLGMLYDCRKDSLVPGMSLWDRDDLKNHIGERPQSYNDCDIVASESIEDKSKALNVEASLKASFLGGLVEVGGSAKYLNDSKTSKNHARVTLNYQATTKFHELSMNHLGDVKKHQFVFEKGIATHVVTGILYGAQAFFVFDREVSVNEKHRDIQGNLNVTIKNIPSLSIEGEGSLKMEDKDKANVEKLSCRFFGDFLIPKPPTSFQEAVEVYQSLPKLLGANGENAVPVKVWLLPLTCLDSTAAKLVRQISIGLVEECQSVLEDMMH